MLRRDDGEEPHELGDGLKHEMVLSPAAVQEQKGPQRVTGREARRTGAFERKKRLVAEMQAKKGAGAVPAAAAPTAAAQ